VDAAGPAARRGRAGGLGPRRASGTALDCPPASGTPVPLTPPNPKPLPTPPRTPTPSDLKGKGIKGTLPDDPQLWADLAGLKTADFSDNPSLVGAVPAALSSAPALVTM
jgi:hypothetical protein